MSWDKIDFNILRNTDGLIGGENKVSYTLYKEKADIPVAPEKHDGYNLEGVCFSDLLYEVSNYNRIYYKPGTNLSKNQTKQWIDFCVKYKLLPSYVSSDQSGYVLKIDNEVPPSLLYVWLCLIRHVWENPDFCVSVIHLVENEMDVYAALVTATLFNVNGAGHNFLSLSSSDQYDYLTLAKVRIPIAHIISLRRFMENPKKYDNRICGKADGKYWRTSTKIESIFKMPKRLTFKQLFKPMVVKAIYAETDEEAKKLLAEVKDFPSKMKRSGYGW